MDPEVFGPILWKSIHIIALGYPENPSELDKTMYMTFFRDLWKVIPCYKCSVNYKRHWDELPITPYLISKEKLFEWTVLLHNVVNKELGKSEINLADAWKIYTEIPNYKKTINNSNIAANTIGIYSIVVLLIIILLFILFRKK
jgi:hypothetical protein